jgi:hypothetical protein
MPRIDWHSLPRDAKEHLTQRLRERKISVSDLKALEGWIQSNPELPEGDWYKDFGSFKLAGRGNRPSTLLEKGMAARGIEI